MRLCPGGYSIPTARIRIGDGGSWCATDDEAMRLVQPQRAPFAVLDTQEIVGAITRLKAGFGLKVVK